MSQIFWRIATDSPSYQADDVSGAGAKVTGGRWNESGVPVLYTSETRALACLETIVHLNAGGLPLNRYLVEIKVPDSVWQRARRESQASLKIGWDAEPAGRVSIEFGTHWLRSMSSALLVVPSIIVPEEFNMLINPAHPESVGVMATKKQKWLYDPRLLR